MRAGSTRLVCAAALAAAALVACKGKPSGPAQPPLAAPPPPPALAIAPEALPTTGLTVVASRPHEVVGRGARPHHHLLPTVVPLMSVEEQKALAPPASLSPAVEGEWRWIGSASVELFRRRRFPSPPGSPSRARRAQGRRRIDPAGGLQLVLRHPGSEA